MEANWIAIAALTMFTGVAVSVARLLFRRWINPLSAYSALWGFCLINYEFRLIQYYPISIAAWSYIYIAWFSLYLGAGLILLIGPRISVTPRFLLNAESNKLKTAVLILSVIGSAGVVGQIISVSHTFGVAAVLMNPGDIYRARIGNEMSGIPYAGAFSFAACTLAGIHVAKAGKFTSFTIIPVVLVTLQLLFMMGRTGLGIAAVLFLVPLLYVPRDPGAVTPRWQWIGGGAALAVTLSGAFVFVSAIRGLQVDFPGITPTMDRISEYVPFAPSLYSNFSATPVAFSQYLDSPEANKTGFWGMYTFAPVFRGASKLGFATEVPAYEENYWTPVPMNTSTYLKNVYSDFGPMGICLFPLMLGALTMYLVQTISAEPRMLAIVILANVYVLVVFSFAFDFMLLGDWYIGIMAGVIAALIVGKTAKSTAEAQHVGKV